MRFLLIPASSSIATTCPILLIVSLWFSQFMHHISIIHNAQHEEFNLQRREENPLPPAPTHSLRDGLNISWIGDLWIFPPGARNYGISELKSIFSSLDILWIGDSTMRRSYVTLFEMLNSTNNGNRTITTQLSKEQVDSEQVLEPPTTNDTQMCASREWTKVDSSTLCRQLDANGHNYKFDYVAATCLQQITNVIHHHQFNAQYDWIIVSGGTWDMAPHKRHVCGHRDGPPSMSALQTLWDDLLTALQTLDAQIVWRTLAMNQHELERDLWRDFNQYTQSMAPSHISYIDFATALEPRTVLYERIAGNNIYHVGLAARLLFIQILANQVLLWKVSSDRHGQGFIRSKR